MFGTLIDLSDGSHLASSIRVSLSVTNGPLGEHDHLEHGFPLEAHQMFLFPTGFGRKDPDSGSDLEEDWDDEDDIEDFEEEEDDEDEYVDNEDYDEEDDYDDEIDEDADEDEEEWIEDEEDEDLDDIDEEEDDEDD